MCSPCGPMVCYKYEDCGPATKSKPKEGTSRAEESGGKKNDETENPLKRIKSRELRGGIMYYSCHCIKRNGLQHDCRRTGCGGEPACLLLPNPVCAPSQLARARGLADPAPLEAHMRAQGGGAGGSQESRGGGTGKRFIVCELKGITPDIATDKSGKCCKCPSAVPKSVPQGPGPSSGKVGACIMAATVPVSKPTTTSGADKNCTCCKGLSSSDSKGTFIFDEKTINKILSSFENKEVAKDKDDVVIGPGGRPRKVKKPEVKEPCTREGCVHWQPPPPCCWDAPCKADCFETPPGIRPGRNPLTRHIESGYGNNATSGGSGQGASKQGQKQPRKMILLTLERCTS